MGTHLLGAGVALFRRKGSREEEVHGHLEGVSKGKVSLPLTLPVLRFPSPFLASTPATPACAPAPAAAATAFAP